MAKSKDATGKMTEQLKEKTEVAGNPDLKPVGPDKDAKPTHVVKKDRETGEVKVEPVADKNPEAVAKDEQSDEMISKPEAELLARKFLNKKKEEKLPLRQTIKEVKDRNKELQELKAKRKQQPTRIIRDLRQYDPAGKKTCGRCAQRVLIATMDSKQDLCEVCAS